MNQKIRVTVWNEFLHERTEENIKAIYPDGIHGQIASFLHAMDEDAAFEIRTATQIEPECGLPDEVLNNTDVLIWWGHMLHEDVPDALVAKIKERVYVHGMGFIALHSAHMSKPFRAIIGTSGLLVCGDCVKEIVWNVNPAHPIAAGIGEHFVLESEEMYGEHFAIPRPDELVFTDWFENGFVFRGGCCWNRGLGKIFYFQPGHEDRRSYYDKNVQRIIYNAVKWAKPGNFGFLKTECFGIGNPKDFKH